MHTETLLAYSEQKKRSEYQIRLLAQDTFKIPKQNTLLNISA